MIQKVSRPGKGFRGVLNYCLDPEKSPELLTGNMAGEDSRRLAHEFRDAREANQAVTKPVFHTSLSAAPGDQLTSEQWREIAETYIERMGYKDSLWVAIRHHDTEHDHVHLIASRVAFDGTRVPDRQEKKRGEEILRDLERAYGIRRVAPSREAARAALGRDELAVFERTGQVTVKARLQEHVDLAARQRPTMSEFAERLAAQGVGFRPNIAKTGHVSGVSYELDGLVVKGSDLGRSYSWRGLKERKGVTYDPARDLPTLRASGAAALSRPPQELATPPSAPLPEIEKAVPAYRAATVLATRLELHERTSRLEAEQFDIGGRIYHALQIAAEHSREATWADHVWRSITDRLGEVYQDPRDAGARLAALIEAQGHERSARLLEHRPAELGPLRGAGLGKLRTASRREAHARASFLARDLRDLGAVRAKLLDLVGRDHVAARDLASDQLRAAYFRRTLRNLPPMRDLRFDLARSATTLGQRLVSALTTRSQLAIVRSAFNLIRSLARDRDHGLDR